MISGRINSFGKSRSLGLSRSSGLSNYQACKLGLRLLWREMKSGQLRIISFALILAVTVATIISVFSSRMEAGMLAKSTELLGADLRLRSSQEIPPFYEEKAKEFDLRTANTAEFPSVVLAGEDMALAAVKVVSQAYPLKGSLFVSQSAFTSGTEVFKGPPPGEVWVESRLLALLDAELGAKVEVGKSEFIITQIIQQESDRGGNFYSLSPRLMMNMQDLAASELIQTGSRVTWRLLVANQAKASTDNEANNALGQYIEWLEPRLSTTQSLESLSDSNLALAASLDKASQYLSLAAILAILLAGIAIAMSAKDYAKSHFDSAALIRTLGATQRQILIVFVSQLLFLATIASLIGLLLGGLLQEQLAKLISVLFINELPAPQWSAWAIASVTAPVTLLGFAAPELMRLSKVSPLRILRRDLEPLSLGIYSVYSIAALTIFGLCVWFTQDIKLSLIVIVGGAICIGIMLIILRALIKFLFRIIPTSKWTVYRRFSWNRVMRNDRTTSTQVMAFALIGMVMIIISVVRSDLLADWQRSLPADAPNFFAMNIQSFEAEDYKSFLEDKDIIHKPLFPMVPGRLTHINDAAVKDDPERREDPALQRDLALTWSEELPEGNKILEGEWFNQDSSAAVSVESRVGKRLGINIGDSLRFEVAGNSFEVRVNSIRSVDWGTLTPNFYMILSQAALEQLPVNYLTSFYIDESKAEHLTSLIRAFPTVTLLDMNMVFTQIQTLLSQVTLAVEYLLALVLFGGVLVLAAAIVTTLDDRLKQSAMLRTLGALKSDLRSVQWSEFALLGLLSAFIALAGAELICYLLYSHLLDLEYRFQSTLWILVPLMSTLLITLLGAFSTRKVASMPPMSIFRDS